MTAPTTLKAIWKDPAGHTPEEIALEIVRLHLD